MKVTAVRYLTFVGLFSLLIGGGLYLAASRRDRPKHDERTAAATAPTTNAANEVSHSQEPSGSNPPALPPEAVKRPNVFGLSGPVQLDDVPDGRFRNELTRLNATARRQALEKLGRLHVPLNDVASLSVDQDGQLLYQCRSPGLPPPPFRLESALQEGEQVPVVTPDQSVSAFSVPVTSPPVRHSRPGATKVIYLDFNGETISGTAWNNSQGVPGELDSRPAVGSYVAKPFNTDGDPTTFNDSEQNVIIKTWERVTEDFKGFDVDVTTEPPLTFTSTTGRILITDNVDANGVSMPSPTRGGVAYLDVFGRSDYVATYSPALVYANQQYYNEGYIAEAASHEIGHNLSLSHDGTASGDEYYWGHGTGENSWGPIMGAAYDKNVTQWSKGEYYNANNQQDDLAVIAGHLGYMPDDYSDSNATAAPLTVSGLTVSGAGIIAQTNEADRFSFASGPGAITLNASPFHSSSYTNGGDLDLALELYDSSGNLLASANVDGITSAALNTTVAGGTYYLRVFGAGSGTPLNNPPTGYTSYGSLGQYTISGTVVSTAPVVPSFTNQPANQTVYTGLAAQFTVVVVGYPAPAFRWQRLPAGSVTWSDLSDGGSYSGTTTVTISIASPTTAMNGDQFRCVASSSAGTATSNSATFTVNAIAAPSFAVHPISQTISIGLPVTFTATASGVPAPAYQWRKDGVNISGATSSSYTIASIGAGDAGNYTAVATNFAGTDTSNIAVLTVQSIPAFITQPVNQTVTAGNPVTFTAAAGGLPLPTYQWMKNGEAISGATGSSYSIATVALTDSGSYSVVATNSSGSATSTTALLLVQTLPIITTQPASQTVTAGSSVTFTAAASGFPAPTYQWKKGGVNITGATSGTYLIASVTANDTGNYTVVATNSAGSATSGVAALTVQYAPVFTTTPSSQTVFATKSVAFTAAASGVPVPTFQWQKDGVNINGAVSNSYTIASTVVGDAGNYTVVATNSIGSVTCSPATLTVNPASIPVFVTQPSDQAVSVGRSVTLTALASGIPAVTYQWLKNGDNIAGAIGSSYTIGAATLTDAGYFAVVATNAVGTTTSNTVVLTVYPANTAYTFTTLAGHAAIGSVDGIGSAARFYQPSGVAVDAAGNVYVADSSNFTIRKTTPGGVVTTLAGLAGSLGSTDGTGISARFAVPYGVAVDGAGNVYVADTVNDTIRKISPVGVVTTLAGTAASTGSVDGTGTAARFNQPYGVAVDSVGNVYVADTSNNAIRKITPLGVVTTLAGAAGFAGSADGIGSDARFRYPTDVTVDTIGNVFVADNLNQTIRKIDPDGVVTTLAGSARIAGSADGTGSAARFTHPRGLAVDAAGNVYVSDFDNATIRKITSSGVVTTLAGSVNARGSADGTGSAARFNYPAGMAADGEGNLYVADDFNHAIRKITPEGVVTTFAGYAGFGSADGTGGAAKFANPNGVAVDRTGNAYVADTLNHTIRKIAPGGIVTTVAGMAGVRGSVDDIGEAARFSDPYGVAADGAGNVYVTDSSSQTIRKIDPVGVVTTIAGGYLNQTGSTDGVGRAALFNKPTGVAVDNAGNVYVADYLNHTIRKITPTGVVTTFAGLAGSSGSADGTGSTARFLCPVGVAVDSGGNVYVADSKNAMIRKITSEGVVSTFAGAAGLYGSTDATGSAARFTEPKGISVDSWGDVYVSDTGTIRQITPARVVATLAGASGRWGSVDGTASAVRFNNPTGVAVDSAGNIYVTDTDSCTIRWGALTPPVLTSASTASGILGHNFTYAAVFGGSLSNYIASGLPDGLSIDFASGLISGAPTVVGAFSVSLGAINGAGPATAILTLTITPDIAINPTPVPPSDFNHDNRSDILWTNTATGDRAIWFMNGTTVGTNAFAGTVPVAWTVSGTGDFDGDGMADIFWTNTTTGDRAMWLMNGSAISSGAYLGVIPVEWVVGGTGDFDGDGKADILWSNTATGDRAVWLMNGGVLSAGASLGVVPLAWVVSGTGDFNGDGKTDILLSNTVTGDRVMWFMNGTAIGTNAFAGTVPVAWAVSGTGDFDGDGKADIFWTNTLTGDRAAWLMNGNTNSAGGYLGAIPVEWVISGTGDYNGDGKADILWSNTVTGERSMWLMNGLIASGGASLGVVPVAWVPAN